LIPELVFSIMALFSPHSTISNFNIYSVVVSPNYASDQTVFACSWGGGVYKTTDGGENWYAVTTGYLTIISLAISPNYASDHTVFAGSYWEKTVYKTTDGGANWTAVLTGTSGTCSLAISPDYATDETVYVGGFSGMLYKTTNGGVNWTAVNSGVGSNAIIAFAVSPDYAADQTVYAGTTDRGIFKTTNGGTSWNNIGLTSNTIHSIDIFPNFENDLMTVYVGTGWGGPHGGGPSQGVFKSTDSGSSWTMMNSGLPNNLQGSSPTITISPNYATDQTVYAGTIGFGVFSYTLSTPCTDNDNDSYAVEGGECGAVDCDDTDASINPGVSELCDGVDNDCDGTIDEGFTDTDTDGIANCVDTDDDNDGIYDTEETACGSDPLDAFSTCEICDGLDNDLDGDIDEGFDADGDGTADCNDGCPNDPNKVAPGACGCGVADTDTDGDGTADCNDLCPNDPAKTDPGACGCGVADTDTDGDGTPDCNDGCPNDPAKTDPGACGCGVGLKGLTT